MSEYSPDIRRREAYEMPREDEILELRELMLDFAEVWPARATMRLDKIVTEALAEYDEEVWTAVGEHVRVRHAVQVLLEDYNDAADHERYTVTVSARVMNRLPWLSELDGQLFVVADRIPEPQKQRYIVSFQDGAVSARATSMDMRLNRTTARKMTRYDVAELMKALDDYMTLDDEASEYTDGE